MRALVLCCIVSLPAAAKTLVVHPGESIQAAVDRAGSGDRVLVLAGTYREAVVVNRDGITLESKGATLVNPGAQALGIAFAPPHADRTTCLGSRSGRLQGATARGFTVRGFRIGIFFLCAENVVAEENTTVDNTVYGVFPSHVVGGRISRNHASGANDTGIYIGQSRNVRVEDNVAQDNTSGFEVENSSGVTVRRNLATGNTAGFLTFTLPDLDVPVNSGNTIEDNVSAFNNRDACTPGEDVDIVCLVPSGTGILAIAVQGNVIRRNLVVGNRSFGIALADYCSSAPDPRCGNPPDPSLGIDPLPNGNRISDNVAVKNGGNPDTSRIPAAFASDLFWTGAGERNCWSRNVAQHVVSPVPLPACR